MSSNRDRVEALLELRRQNEKERVKNFHKAKLGSIRICSAPSCGMDLETEGGGKRCGVCLCVSYCSKECQVSWAKECQ